MRKAITTELPRPHKAHPKADYKPPAREHSVHLDRDQLDELIEQFLELRKALEKIDERLHDIRNGLHMVCDVCERLEALQKAGH